MIHTYSLFSFLGRRIWSLGLGPRGHLDNPGINQHQDQYQHHHISRGPAIDTFDAGSFVVTFIPSLVYIPNRARCNIIFIPILS